jgi:LPXTG-motif cell wall-anchored protein
MRRLTKLLTLAGPNDEGTGGGGLPRAVVAATPPRRSALLRAFLLVFLACVLGLAGAGTALAQDGGDTPQPPNPQYPPPPDGDGTPPQPNPQYPPPPDEPVIEPFADASLTGSCDPASGVIKYSGVGWEPRFVVNIFLNGARHSTYTPGDSTAISGTIDAGLKPGETAQIGAAQATGAGQISASAIVKCPNPPTPQGKPEITATCDPAAQTATVKGAGWTPGRSVEIRVLQGLETAVPDGNGAFEATIRGEGAFTAGKTLTIDAAQPGTQLKASTTAKCEEPTPGGPAITATCDPAAQTVTVRGTGWKPGQVVATEVLGGPDEVLGSASPVPDANGAFEAVVRYVVQGAFSAGRTLTVDAQDAQNGLKASTTAKCQDPQPPPGGPKITASCDPAAQNVTVRGTGWTPEQAVDIRLEGVLQRADPDANGAFVAVVREGSFTAGKTLTVEAAQAGTDLKASTTVRCPQPPGPGPGGVIPPPVRDAFTGLLAGQLPETGGGWAVLLVAGAALIGSGWFVVRLARRLAAR